MDADLQISQLTRALSAGEDIWAVHYACESFYELLDHPPAVSAIGVSRVPPGEDQTFSVVDSPGAAAEQQALEGFYRWLRGRPDAHIVHWNMNKSDFGWDALAKRFAYIAPDGASVAVHSHERLYDLDELLKARHGAEYARNPKLSTLMTLNALSARYSLTGQEQADAYRAGDHAALARSTADRVRAIAQIAVDDVRTEDFVPETAGARSRIDFILPGVGLGIEVKVARETMTRDDLGGQLIIDSASVAGGSASYTKRSIGVFPVEPVAGPQGGTVLCRTVASVTLGPPRRAAA